MREVWSCQTLTVQTDDDVLITRTSLTCSELFREERRSRKKLSFPLSWLSLMIRSSLKSVLIPGEESLLVSVFQAAALAGLGLPPVTSSYLQLLKQELGNINQAFLHSVSSSGQPWQSSECSPRLNWQIQLPIFPLTTPLQMKNNRWNHYK